VFWQFRRFSGNWPIAPFGEFFEFDTKYGYDSDRYHLDIIFVCLYQLLRFSAVFEIYGQYRGFLRLPGFRVFLKIGVLIPNFHGFHVILFNV
jgi:hypothetical protein